MWGMQALCSACELWKQELEQAYRDIRWLLDNTHDQAAVLNFRKNWEAMHPEMQQQQQEPWETSDMQQSSRRPTEVAVSPPGGMSDTDFQELLEAISAAPSQTRIQLILDATEYKFTCRQLDEILGVLTFEDEKQEAIDLVAPRLLDPDGYQALSSEAARKAVEKVHRKETIFQETNFTDEDMKKLKARVLVLEEIVQTERDYVSDLENVVDKVIHKLWSFKCVQVFIQPINERGLLSKQECNSIFSNIMVLLPLNKQILADFENRQEDYVGDVFLRMVGKEPVLCRSLLIIGRLFENVHRLLRWACLVPF